MTSNPVRTVLEGHKVHPSKLPIKMEILDVIRTAETDT